MDIASSLPIWAQAVMYISIALSIGLGAGWKYVKTQDKTPEGKANVVTASFVNDRTLKDLIQAIQELQDETSRDTKKSHRMWQDFKEAVNELTEAIIVQTDTTMNLVRFVNREAKKEKNEHPTIAE